MNLTNAPHRLLFAIGAGNVLLAMAWWALWLVDLRWQLFGLQQPAVYGGWIHAIVMQYQVLAPFMFGFLLTVFPRWTGQDELTRWHYVPVGVGLFGGQLLTLAGALGPAHLLHLGALFANGWLTAKLVLLVVYVVLGVFALRRGRSPTIRAVCYVAALLVFATIFGIARYHHPLGWLLPHLA